MKQVFVIMCEIGKTLTCRPIFALRNNTHVLWFFFLKRMFTGCQEHWKRFYINYFQYEKWRIVWLVWAMVICNVSVFIMLSSLLYCSRIALISQYLTFVGQLLEHHLNCISLALLGHFLKLTLLSLLVRDFEVCAFQEVCKCKPVI